MANTLQQTLFIKAKWIAVILCPMLIMSCSYRWLLDTNGKGKRILYKKYKNNVDMDNQVTRLYIFENNERLPNKSKYSRTISSDTTHGSTYITFDTCRIYLFNEAKAYKELFTSGLLSAQFIYCSIDSNCKPREERLITDMSGKPIIYDLWRWTGHTIAIEYVKLLTNVKSKGTQRRFEVWVHPHRSRTNDFNMVYLLELTNETANKDTKLSEFIKGAYISLFKQAWVRI